MTDYIWRGVKDVTILPGYLGYAEIRDVGPKKAIVWNLSQLQPVKDDPTNGSATLNFTVTLAPDDTAIFILNRGEDLMAEGKYGAYVAQDKAELDIVVPAYVRDVMAVSQTPAKTAVIQGEIVGIGVVVKNNGTYYVEIFDVTLTIVQTE